MMENLLDRIIDAEAWSDDLRSAVAADPELAARVALWHSVSAQVGEELAASLPSPQDLVHVGLVRSGQGGLLRDAERARVTESEALLDVAATRHPSVAAILQRLDADIRAFDDAWGRAVRPDRPAVRPARISGVRRLLWPTVAAAAVVVAVWFSAPEAPSSLTGTGAPVTLADGSVVRLETGAVLTFDADAPRRVTLEGRAFFDVQPSDIPFTVTTDDAVTAVLGTSFGVADSDDGTRVTVVTGRVSVEASGRAVVLAPGQVTNVPAGNTPDEPVIAALTDLSWTGLFIFRDTPIDSVAAILSDAFLVDIEVDSLLASQVLTGTFDRDQGLEEILAVVASALGASVEPIESGQRYRLVPIKP